MESNVKNMPGRPRNKAFDTLGFMLEKSNGKYSAVCCLCNKKLLNTAENRLKGHRNVCNQEINRIKFNEHTEQLQKKQENANLIILSEDVKDAEPNQIQEDPLNIMEMDFTSDLEDNPKEKLKLPQPCTSASVSSKRNTRSCNKYNRFEVEYNEALGKFIFACNLPLNIVNSVHFKSFIKKLRPSYASKIPNIKLMLSTVLDNAYQKNILATKASMSPEAVILMESWDNCSTNTKTVMTLLKNFNGETFFLDAWELTNDSDTIQKWSEIIVESVDLAKDRYSIDVYAFISENAGEIVKLKNIPDNLWHMNCSRHIGNLFANDILDKRLTDKVTLILNEFKQSELEDLIVKVGGTKMILPIDTKLSSYLDSYRCLVYNWQYIKCIAADLKDKQITENISKLVFDDNFLETVEDNLMLFEPICELLSKLKSPKCLAADAVNFWIDLKLPKKFEQKFGAKLQSRRDAVLNEYALAAFYMHPYYDTAKLNNDQKNIIVNFLFNQLDGCGIEEWDSFRSRTSFFKRLYEKNIRNPLVFWNFAATHHPTLSKLALKLLQIPAGSAQIQTLFKNWNQVHSSIQNQLTFEQSKKLFNIYYSLRNADDSFDEDDFNYELDM